METIIQRLLQVVSVAFKVLVITLFFVGCNKKDDEGPQAKEDLLKPAANVTTTVLGTVVDEDGKPVSSVQISVHGETATTESHGSFILENISVPGNRCVIKGAKEGYFPGIRAVKPFQQSKTEARIVLMRSVPTHTFDAASGLSADVGNGPEIQIPANGLRSLGGGQYSGQVTMSVRHLDPTAGGFGVVVPGGDMLARREDESSSILYSYGVLRVKMTGAGGEDLQLADSSTSSLVMKIPADQVASAPETMPLWYFDEEEGFWKEEGVATKQGDKYIGNVTHFSDWNADDPKESARIIGRLIDCNNKPGWGVVEFGQIASDPQSSAETGETDGRFDQRVPAGVSITVVINNPLIIAPLTPVDRGKVIVVVPPLSPGQVYDVGDIQTFPCSADLLAVIKPKPNDQVNSVTFSTDKGSKSLYNAGETIKTTLPPNTQITMSIQTAGGTNFEKTFTTPGERETLDLGVIDLAAETAVGVIAGQIVCFGKAETQGQITAEWQESGSTKYNYSSPNADGTFEVEAPLNIPVKVSSSTASGNWTQDLEPLTSGGTFDLGTIEICENPVIGTTNFTISGGGFDNSIIELISNKNNERANYAYYTGGNEPNTLVFVENLEKSYSINLAFPGKAIGATDAAQSFIRIVKTVDGVKTNYEAGVGYPGTSVSITITKFDEVGGAVEGTFNGTLRVTDQSGTPTGEMATVTNGQFSVLRYPDLL